MVWSPRDVCKPIKRSVMLVLSRCCIPCVGKLRSSVLPSGARRSYSFEVKTPRECHNPLQGAVELSMKFWTMTSETWCEGSRNVRIPSYQVKASYEIFMRATFGTDITAGLFDAEDEYTPIGPSSTFDIKNEALQFSEVLNDTVRVKNCFVIEYDRYDDKVDEKTNIEELGGKAAQKVFGTDLGLFLNLSRPRWEVHRRV
ncbi:hypothetical protein BJ878DRAFT_574580 [Calycina marina]|uniref:Uncharacterized protein n=1 Tax=Calycina marina TaxID=1763456 RepID=A0A9P7Z5L3_9HELO|nr:hypothetical protein BJ878DRAFT_574580 [Calycina marina]